MTGLTLPISEKTGIGCLRLLAISKRAFPPVYEPVKATAFTDGCFTKYAPTSIPPSICAKTPSGILVRTAAFSMAEATSRAVSRCAGCAFTTTGQPAAKAEAVSPPAVENANGKLLAPKTTTGPIGTSIFLKSTFGMGCRSGIAVSMVASTHEPSST